MTLTYFAKDGSKWHLSYEHPPVPNRGFDWCASHDDYDGAPDSKDDRMVFGETEQKCIAAIEEFVEHQDD